MGEYILFGIRYIIQLMRNISYLRWLRYVGVAILLPVICWCVTLSHSRMDSSAQSAADLSRVENRIRRQAVQQEIKRIESRERTREVHFQRTISLYAALHRGTEIYPYQNQYKSRLIQQRCIEIVQEVFQNRHADLQRFEALQHEVH